LSAKSASHLHGVQGAASSNLAAPTNSQISKLA